MIKFFRKIRRQLLSQNKVSKYLLYAIGEIALVVIGILLALQVNNWNEGNRIKKLENSTLSEISNALESDLSLINNWVQIAQLQNSNVSKILNFLEDNGPYTEDLDKSWQSGFLRPIYVFNTSPYELLKSRGFDIIRNDSVRRDIQHHYDISIPYMIDYLDRNYDLMTNFRNKYISQFRKGSVGIFTPTNIESLRNEEILNGLSMLGFWHQNTVENLIDLKGFTEKLNSEIVEYLKTQ